MSFRINSRDTLDTLENTGFTEGEVLGVNLENDTADLHSEGVLYKSVPVFYNCPQAGSVQRNGSIKNSAKALCRGDMVIARTYKGKPSHIIGFKDTLWPCINVPAFAMGEVPWILDNKEKSFFKPCSELFAQRYKELSLSFCYRQFQFFINDSNADISSGFVSFQTHWTDSRYHRKTEVFYEGAKIYETYNNETFSNIFNGTRSNVLGAFSHPSNGWGALVYQINTFYDWKPQVSGRVTFDYFLYTSAGHHTKLASAHADITGETVQAAGERAGDVRIYASEDIHTGAMLTGIINKFENGIFSSDGSTNQLLSGDSTAAMLIQIREGTDKPELTLIPLSTDTSGAVKLPDGSSADEYRIYIKNR